MTAGLAGGEESAREPRTPRVPSPAARITDPGEMDGAMWGAPEALQLPLSLEQGGGSCHRGEPSWHVGGGEEQRAEEEADWKETGPGEQGLGEAALPRLSPSTQEQKEANPGGQMGPLASR